MYIIPRLLEHLPTLVGNIYIHVCVDIYVYIYIYICVCVCMYVRMDACMHGWVDGWVDGGWMSVCMYGCMHACMDACTYGCMYVRTYVCMCVCNECNVMWCDVMYVLFSVFLCIFPECVARVPVSLWGSGGWGCVRSTLRSRAQPSATVRAIPVWPCLWEVLQRWSFLGVADVSLLRFAWQAWHFVTFRLVLERVESRLAWQAQYFCDVFRRCVAVFVAGAALGRVHRHFSWQAQHFRRVVLRVFVNRIGRAASSGDKVQIPWQAWHFVTCAENWRKPRTKHRFWGCKFSGSKENS